MILREIEVGSEDFQKERELRQEILRTPLGLSLDPLDLGQESREKHFGIFDGENRLLACVIAVPVSRAGQAKICQMAVRGDWQGKGLGRRIMLGLEDHLARAGFREVFMHARLSAAEFYEKLGYARSGGEFTEVGIPHVRMEKDLPNFPKPKHSVTNSLTPPSSLP